MPLPLLIVIPSLIAGVVGGAQAVSASKKNSQADRTLAWAKSEFDEAKKNLDDTREETNEALANLGKTRLTIWSTQIAQFLEDFSKIKNVEIPEILSEKSNISDKMKLKELKTISSNSGAVLQGLSGAASMGALAGVGAYAGVGWLATASTGTAISTLSGAAATNATLAWLGGGSLASGGLGMAGGAWVLGGAVLGPALLVGGWIMDSKADARLAEARATAAKSEKAQAQMNRARIALSKVQQITGSMIEALTQIASILERKNDELKSILQKSGDDYAKYSAKEKKRLHAIVEIAHLLVTALEVPLLTEKGNLKRGIGAKIDKFIEAGKEAS